MTFETAIQLGVAVLCAFGVFFLNDIRGEIRDLSKKIDSKADKTDVDILEVKVDKKQDKTDCFTMRRECKTHGGAHDS